jgi:hypothetical protein
MSEMVVGSPDRGPAVVAAMGRRAPAMDVGRGVPVRTSPSGRTGVAAAAWFTPEIVRAVADSIGMPVATPPQLDAIAHLTKNVSQLGAVAAILLARGSVGVRRRAARPPSS